MRTAPRASRLRVIGWSIGGLVAAGLLAILAWGLAHPATGATSAVIGRPAPDLAVTTFDGRSLAVASFRGHPLVLNFWASWCGPCRQEAKVLADASRANPAVSFLGAAIEDSDGAARAFETEFQVPYADGLDAQAGYLRYGVTGPPETYFIDASGVVRDRYAGPLDAPTLALYIGRLKP